MREHAFCVRYTVFTFVRDPLSRFLSAYFSTMKWVKMKRHAPCVKRIAAEYARAGDPLAFLAEGDIDHAAERQAGPLATSPSLFLPPPFK
jgi:hypothetical protein